MVSLLLLLKVAPSWGANFQYFILIRTFTNLSPT